MKREIIISAAAALFISGALLGPPDAVSQTVYGIEGALICAIPLLILSRYEFFKSSAKQIQTLICVLVCMVSILMVTCQISWRRICDVHTRMTALEGEGLEAAQAGQ